MSKSIKELLEFSFINLDKPSGPTSFQVSDYIRQRLAVRKTSHLGTLDPAVSGVLPIALNRACRLATYFMKKEKRYVGILRLHETIETEVLEKAMKQMTGKITQIPPLRSSVKRAERTREVQSFDFIEREGKDVLFDAHVEAGTYIRTLVHDLGKKIGGAHMLELRRTHAGIFEEEDAITVYHLDNAIDEYTNGNERLIRLALIPAEEVIRQSLPTLNIKKNNLSKILTGKPIHLADLQQPSVFEKSALVAVFSGEQFIEIARVVNEGETIAVPDFVFN